MSLGAKFAAQFRKPEGRGGAVGGWVIDQSGATRPPNAETVKRREIAPGGRGRGLGGGPGLALAAAAARATAGRVVGVDHSPLMIEQARARLRKLGLERQV